MLLSIIIVSYNTATLTKRAIQSVLRDLNRSDALRTESEILVIDNNSTDNSTAVLRALKRTSTVPFTLIEQKNNPGFAAANNTGIARSSGKYVLLLNPDTYVQAGCLEKLVFSLERLSPVESTAYSLTEPDPYDRVGIVAATLLNPNGTLQPQGGDLPSLASVAIQFFLLDDIPFLGKFLPSTQHRNRNMPPVNYDLETELDLIPKGWVGGTAMLIRRQVIDEIGTLDENIFMYGEDVEFCLRAQSHHWDVVQHPTARVTHVQSASAGSAHALIGEAQGLLYIFAKHKPIWQKNILTGIVRLGALLRLVLFTLLNRPSAQLAPYEKIWQHANNW